MSRQVVAQETDYGLGQNIRGEKYGLLTALHPVGRQNGNVLWLLQCECGRLAQRTLGSLNTSRKKHQEPQCTECLVELRRGRASSKYAERIARRIVQYEETGSLWSDWDEDRLRSEIVSDLCEVFGQPVEFPALPPLWFFGVSEVTGSRRLSPEEEIERRQKLAEKREKRRSREVNERRLGTEEMKEVARWALMKGAAMVPLRTGS